MEYTQYFHPIPSLDVVILLAYVNMGSTNCPIDCGHGLLSKTLTQDTWVLTPSFFLPKVKKEWDFQRLGIEETLACFDFLDDWAKWIPRSGVNRDSVEAQAAMACSLAGSTRWLDALFRSNGGILFF